MTIHIYDPTGAVEQIEVQLAPRPAARPGLRIAVLDNKKFNAGLLLTTIAGTLSERYGAELTLTEGKPTATLAAPDEVVARIGQGADLVLTGSAD
jgi:hypothetical protein